MSQSKSRGRLLVVIAIVLGLLTCVATYGYLGSLQQKPEMVSVFYIKTLVPARTRISASQIAQFFQEREIPVEYAPRSAVKPADVSALTDSVVALTDLQPGDILQWNQLDRHGGLKPDMRAVSIAVDMVTSAGGNLGVGKRVDVLASYEQDEGGGRKIPRTILLLSDVEVLAVYSPPLSFGTRPLPGETPTPNTLTNVTLSVSLRDAMRLTWMSNFAKEVRLVVRRTDEKAPLPSIPPVDQSTFK